jgi:hypothetical protein
MITRLLEKGNITFGIQACEHKGIKWRIVQSEIEFIAYCSGVIDSEIKKVGLVVVPKTQFFS